jgi:glycerophosphoryl diester phosphodiesterase
MHDPTVDRVTTGSGKVEDLSYSDISRFDAGIKSGKEYKGTPVPLLEGAIQLVKGKAELYLDLKTNEIELVVDVVKKHSFSPFVFYRCYLPHIAERLARMDSEARLVLDAEWIERFPHAGESFPENGSRFIYGIDFAKLNIAVLKRLSRDGRRFIINLLGSSGTRGNLFRALALQPYAIQVEDPDLKPETSW